MDATLTWHEENQRYLAAAIASVGELLSRHLGQAPEMAPEKTTKPADEGSLRDLSANLSAPPALDRVVEIFELSSFERDLLVLCAGVELDAELARVCAASSPSGKPDPTFGLALAAFPEAHWSALNPAAPLRRWRLLELEPGGLLTARVLRIDERILHFLTGVQYLDERLAGLIVPLALPRDQADLVPSHRHLAERMAVSVRRAGEDARSQGRPLPVLQLTGPEPGTKMRIAAAAAEALGMELNLLSGSAVPTAAAELDGLQRLWERESALTGSALFLDLDDLDSSSEGGGAARESAVARLVDEIRGLVLISSRGPRRPRRRSILSFEVPRPSPQEQSQLWREALSLAAPSFNGHFEANLDALASQFSLSSEALADAARQAMADATETDNSETDILQTQAGAPEGHLDSTLGPALWNAARRQCRPQVDHLAQLIVPAASWDDLVLPREQTEILQDLATQVRHRFQVHERWGFAAKSSQGLGITALFAGVSGTGKTLTAEVLAHQLQLDLYRIDLAAVISKYIGETEKNLRRVFDAAEQGGAVLLFDEADALFGKRSEIKDSHDRYANVEISYLLQRMEAYRGLAILTTNMKSSLDNAFLRRLRFVVEFPFPDAAQRQEIWQRIFPKETPTEGLEPAKLARLNVAGGNIRNIALGAAFTAADEGSPVRMDHLLRSARAEYRKMEKPLNETETRGWLS